MSQTDLYEMADLPRTGLYVKRGRRWNTLMRIARRIHLYSGLFMLPWVLLYGITAFLFNHPNAFPDHQVRTFSEIEIAGTALEALPSPANQAQQVVAQLRANGTEPDENRATYRLVDPDEAHYTREGLFATATGGGEQHSLRVDLIRGTGTVRSKPEGYSVSKAPFACKEGCRINDPVSDRVGKGMPLVMARLSLASDNVEVRSVPDLIFKMEAENQIWQVTYQMQNGSVSARSIQETGEPLSTRGFLTGLHLAHSFPSQLNASWFWAIVVDAMFVSMMLWAISGLLMWWQLKALRKWGVLALGASAVMTTALVIGMYRLLDS